MCKEIVSMHSFRIDVEEIPTRQMFLTGMQENPKGTHL